MRLALYLTGFTLVCVLLATLKLIVERDQHRKLLEDAYTEIDRQSRLLYQAANRADRMNELEVKLEHQHREDTIAVTAVYQLQKPFDPDDMSFHTFCDEHAEDVVWWGARPQYATLPTLKLVGYGSAPNKVGGVFMECRWSVAANREDWCRRYLASVPKSSGPSGP